MRPYAIAASLLALSGLLSPAPAQTPPTPQGIVGHPLVGAGLGAVVGGPVGAEGEEGQRRARQLTAEPPAARSRPIAELATILDRTDSKDTFLLTVMALRKMGPEAKEALPAVIRTAERLGLVKGFARALSRKARGAADSKVSTISEEVCAAVLEIAAGPLAGQDPSPEHRTAAENREDPEYRPLVIKDKERGIKVAVLIYTPREVQTSFAQVDRQLGEMFAGELRSLAQANKQNIQLVPAQVVEAFKNSHPRWPEMDAAEIGRSLRADYVISLEVNKFSLMEPGSAGLLRGQTQVSATLVDVAHPDDTPLPREVPYIYPQEGPRMSEFDMDRNTFRQEFLSHLARRLSYLFLAHPKRDDRVD